MMRRILMVVDDDHGKNARWSIMDGHSCEKNFASPEIVPIARLMTIHGIDALVAVECEGVVNN